MYLFFFFFVQTVWQNRYLLLRYCKYKKEKEKKKENALYLYYNIII